MGAGGGPFPADLLDALTRARHVCVLTGAGVSAESGVPTFREAQSGLWSRYDPMELATPEAFRRDPALVWRWYRWRRKLVAAAAPNPGHLALARLAVGVPEFTLITQNVDGLHQRAGSTDVIEFHGNLFENRCLIEERAVLFEDDGSDVPACSACGAPLRPGVVWFGEAIPERATLAASAAAESCDLFLSIGTSSQVWPAAGLARTAQQNGALVVEINPGATELSAISDYRIAGQSGTVLPELLHSFSARSENSSHRV